MCETECVRSFPLAFRPLPPVFRRQAEHDFTEGNDGFQHSGNDIVSGFAPPGHRVSQSVTELDLALGCARLSAFGVFLLRSSLFLLFFVAVRAHAGQPFTPGDWWNWRDIGTPRINPEGTAVVYVESWNLRDGDRVCANLWTVPIAGGAAGGAARRLTDGPWRDTSPAWSSDGAWLAYISDRDGSAQIWVRRLDSGGDRSAERRVGE